MKDKALPVMSGSLESHDLPVGEASAPIDSSGMGSSGAGAEGFGQLMRFFDEITQGSDSERLEMGRKCAALLDDGLAPLVAWDMVHHQIAAIVVSTLRVALVQRLGLTVQESWSIMAFPRTVKAITIKSVRMPVGDETSEVGGA